MKSNQNQKQQQDYSQSNSPRHRDQQPLVRFKIQQTRTLMFENAQDFVSQIESKFTDLSINIGTSVPDDVQLQAKNVYVRYPSIEAATAIYQHLKGQITIGNRHFKMQYYPIRRVDLTLAYDWYCQKCDYKNFARRNKCYRCQSPKSIDCRLSYSTQPSSRNSKEQSAQNCSLMIRGPIVGQIEENVLLQTFQAMVPVRDIRQIKNKLTGKFKDFAFVEFFSPEQTAQAYKISNEPNFKIAGQRVTVMYSRNKSDDDYFKPLPYQAGKREKRAKDKPQQQDNYYHRQRQRQIEQEKARPSITMQQLKQKREQQLKKQQQAIVPKEMNQQQFKRRAAQQLAKQWQKQMKVQAVMYICPACCRKFNNAQQMKVHQKMSKFHAYNMEKINSSSLDI